MAKIKGLFKRTGSSVWEYDFIVKGTRHVGSTHLASRRAAELIVAELRSKAKSALEPQRNPAPMTFAEVADLWFRERGQFRKGRNDAQRSLRWLKAHVGEDTPASRLNNALVASLVAQRRSEGVSHATINREVTQLLRAILRLAELHDQPVARINWTAHMLKEPVERVREYSLDEEDRLFATLRPDFEPLMRFLLLTGRRRAEACNLLWQDVDLNGARMTARQKGDLTVIVPLSGEAVAILRSQWRLHPTRCFTYVVQHKQGGKVGSRKPIAPDRLSTEFNRAIKRAGLVNFRLHDARHTTATRMIRATGNLKLAQRALGHANIATTSKYAHATDDDLRAALDTVAAIKSPAKSRDRRQKMKDFQDE